MQSLKVSMQCLEEENHKKIAQIYQYEININSLNTKLHEY